MDFKKDGITKLHNAYFRCNWCKMEICGESQVKQHRNGRKHIANMKAEIDVSNANCDNLMENQDTNNSCGLDDNGSTIKTFIPSELDDIIRKKKMFGPHSSADNFYCNICKVDIVGDGQLKLHLNGRKHTRNKSFQMDINNTTSESFELDQHIRRKKGEHSPYTLEIAKSQSQVRLSNGTEFTFSANLPRQINCDECKTRWNEMIENACSYEQIESEINYTFKDKSFLLEAMTHGSCTTNKLTSNYQRLEFTGDYVLNFLIARELERDGRAKSISPGDLSQRRSVLISNDTFAWLAVKNNFHKYLRSSSGATIEVEEFAGTILQEEEGLCKFAMNDIAGKQEYYSNISENAPKILGDIFESVAGAIYLDSGNDLETVWKVYGRLMEEAFKLY